MKVRLTFGGVFVAVVLSALCGMGLGALFGLAAAWVAPELFAHMVMWAELEPVGTAVVLGAAVGTLLGGGLGVFGIAVQAVVAVWGRRGLATGDPERGDVE